MDREKIRRHLDLLEDAEAAGDTDASGEADVRFHAKIVEASRNTMLTYMMASRYDLTRRGVLYNRAYLRTPGGTGAMLFARHRENAETVIAEEEEAAERTVRNHLDFAEDTFRLGMERTNNEAVSRKRASRSAG